VYLRIEDVLTVPDRGVGVTGWLKGEVKEGDRIWLLGPDVRRAVTIGGVERFRACFSDHTGEGASVGVLLTDVAESEVSRGMLLSSDSAAFGL
jgi:translation elongation factor EF-Tu-like GTPase